MPRKSICLVFVVVLFRHTRSSHAAAIVPSNIIDNAGSNISHALKIFSTLASQWRNPTDVLSVLLIIGGDTIQKALAQLSGGWFVPVVFSFGWVSYSLSALLAVFGEGTLMPTPNCPSMLINAKSGYSRWNYSWVLNQILLSVERQLEPLEAALCVSVYEANGLKKGRVPYDWLWWTGIVAMAVQLAIAAIPCAFSGDWMILIVTVAGTVLAISGGCLPRWKKEKWNCRIDHKNNMYCLTRGNGFQHVVVIRNQGPDCLDLEDLAPMTRYGCSRSCKGFVALLALLWIVLLVSVAGMKQNTWYLLGVGVIGMAQNIIAAAAPREPAVMGLPLRLLTRIKDYKVMGVLMDTEMEYPGLGLALLKTFFPGGLREHERIFWADAEAKMKGLCSSGV